jgi:hypothetical protein
MQVWLVGGAVAGIVLYTMFGPSMTSEEYETLSVRGEQEYVNFHCWRLLVTV